MTVAHDGLNLCHFYAAPRLSQSGWRELKNNAYAELLSNCQWKPSLSLATGYIYPGRQNTTITAEK